MPRISSKTRQWEQQRRDRLKEAFSNLSKLLPCYVPSIPLSKIDILEKSGSYILELQERVKDAAASSDANNLQGTVVKEMKDHIGRLLNKNEVLSNLLREAGIKLPTIRGTVKKFKNRFMWSNRLMGEQAKILQKRELEKENDITKIKVKKTPAKDKSRSKFNASNLTPKHRKVMVNRKENRIKPSRKKKIVSKMLPTSNCVIVLSQSSSTPPCFIITNAPSNNLLGVTASSTVMTNSTLLGNPLMSTNVKSNRTNLNRSSQNFSSLGPGTLILANGAVVPVLPSTQSVLSTALTLQIPPKDSTNTLIVLPKTTANIIKLQQNPILSNIIKPSISSNFLPKDFGQEVEIAKSRGKVLQKLRPKVCLTRTTQVNKVPIPALTSRYSSKVSILDNMDLIKKKKLQKESVRSSKSECIVNKGVKRKAKDAVQVENVKVSRNDEASKKNERNMQINSDVHPISVPEVTENAKDTSSNKETSEIYPKETDNYVEQNVIGDVNIPLEINHSVEELPPILTTSSASDVLQTKCSEESVEATGKMINKENIKANTVLCPNTATNTDKQRFDTNYSEKSCLHDSVNESKIDKESNIVVETIQTNEGNQSNVLPHISNEPEQLKTLDLNLSHSELSNDIFASLQVPTGCQNPESTSPTAAFLLAFPLVSSLTGVKVTEVIDEDIPGSQSGTPTLLQIGAIETTKPSQSESLTPNLLNLDNLSFFSTKEMCNSFYTPFEQHLNGVSTTSAVTAPVVSTVVSTNIKCSDIDEQKSEKFLGIPKITNPLGSGVDNLLASKNDYLQTKISDSRIMCNVNELRSEYKNTGNISSVPINAIENNQSRINMGVGFNVGDKINQQLLPKITEVKPPFVNYNVKYSNPRSGNYNTNNPTKECAVCTYNQVRNYPEPSFTNGNSYNCNYPQIETNFNQTAMKNPPKNDKNCYSINYENYNDYRRNEYGNNSYPETNYSKDKYNNTSPRKQTAVSNKPTINWMTTPNKHATDYGLSSFCKDEYRTEPTYSSHTFVSNTQTSYFNAPPNIYYTDATPNITETKKGLDLPLGNMNSTYQRNDIEDNHFSWSPTKIPQFLEPTHGVVSSTLPTLVGDLALGNSGFGEHKHEIKCTKDVKTKDQRRTKLCYENQTNFLSVSQLVDHNKIETTPAKTSSRRNSGSRSKNIPPNNVKKRINKTNESKDAQCLNKPPVDQSVLKNIKNIAYGSTHYNTFNDTWKKNSPVKHATSNYSAEALIGHQVQTENNLNRRHLQQTYPNNSKNASVPTFLPDVIPYFPPVDLPQENCPQQNQNYQTFPHNFTTFQNNSYSTNTFIPSNTITTTYLNPSLNTGSFTHDMANHDFSGDNFNLFPIKDVKNDKLKNVNNSTTDKVNLHPCSNSANQKKTKRKTTNDANLPGFVDFSFLSMPGTINSPILQEEFHSHGTFLPPPTPSQLYPCKNSLYPKQNDLSSGSLLPFPPVHGNRTNIQHPEISPSTNNMGSSLTNFNLSTIFPEITKGPLSDIYPDARMKEQPVTRNYTNTPISFSHKPTFAYSNCQTTQSYGS